LELKYSQQHIICLVIRNKLRITYQTARSLAVSWSMYLDSMNEKVASLSPGRGILTYK